MYVRRQWLKIDTCIKRYALQIVHVKNLTRCKSNTFLLILHVIKATRIKSYTYEDIHVWNGEFWLVLKHTRMKYSTQLLIRVSFYTRNFWYAYHFIHETFDTRIVLYTKLLIRVYFLTWNFSYVEPLALFVHFGQPYRTRLYNNSDCSNGLIDLRDLECVYELITPWLNQMATWILVIITSG